MKSSGRLAGIFIFSLLLVSVGMATSKHLDRFPAAEARVNELGAHAMRGSVFQEHAPVPTKPPEVRLEDTLLRDITSTETSFPQAHIAVYFKDMTTGVVVGYRDDERFI